MRLSSKARLLLALGFVLGAPLSAIPAAAHEPLWGETPTVFGFGVLHPEFKTMFRDAGRTREEGDRRMRMWMHELGVGYAPSTALNLRLMVPYLTNIHDMRLGGEVHRRRVSGLGDAQIRAKRRFSGHQDLGLNIQHSLIYGAKLPTGRDNVTGPGGMRMDPQDQPGTGNLGFLLGYTGDRETVVDTIWWSTLWQRDLGGGFRMGDMVEVTAAYGRWVKIAREADEVGINLALGVYGEVHTADRGADGLRIPNAYRMAGLHFTPIVTRGTQQFRVGVFVPLVRSGPMDRTRFPFELRGGFEAFF
jgi:hypothetical protein